MKIEDKLNLSEDRGQISKIEDSPLKNQADGQPMHNCIEKLSRKIFPQTFPQQNYFQKK